MTRHLNSIPSLSGLVDVEAEIKPPTYHRQRLLLYLLEEAGGSLSKIDLQKLLLLYIKESEVKHYSFVPYLYGCYSFLAADDLDLLEKREWLTIKGNQIKIAKSLENQVWAQESVERQKLRNWIVKRPARGSALIREVYHKYPYYAIRSKIKDRSLNPDVLLCINKEIDSFKYSQSTMFTIGYEGIHFEDYINKLICNGVTLLCDVRKNPHSRKFGFSQLTLSTILPKMGIAYKHIPQLGIESEKRRNLKSLKDYENLFLDYSKSLPKNKTYLNRVMNLLRKHNRIALTCFEKESQNCHRHCVTDLLQKNYDLTVIHL